MTVHNKGFKSNRDRAVLINAYKVMAKDFNIPKRDRLDAAAIARLSNEMLYKITKDMYSQTTVKQAKKLAIKMGIVERDSWIDRIVLWFTTLRLKGAIRA